MDTVQLIVEVPEERAAFMLELLESIRFVSNPRVFHENGAEEDAQAHDKAGQPAAAQGAED